MNLHVISSSHTLQKHIFVKALFTLTVFEILLIEGGSVSAPVQCNPGSEMVKDFILLNTLSCSSQYMAM